ncbi:MAG: PspA/IM30 family protein [Pirellulales bacterium]
MSIFTRVADIISANVNDLLDRAEDPEKMVKMLVAEMEERIEETREGVARAMAGEKLLEANLQKNRQASAEWQAKAESALARGDEAMARQCLQRKKEYDAITRSLQPQWESARRTSDTLRSDFRRLEEKLDETRRRRDVLIARQQAAAAQKDVASMGPGLSRIQESFGKFDRMERRVEEMEAEATALAELSAERRNLERELATVERNVEVEIELSALKEKMKTKTTVSPSSPTGP